MRSLRSPKKIFPHSNTETKLATKPNKHRTLAVNRNTPGFDLQTTTEDNFEDKIGPDVEYDQENSVAIIGELKEMFHDGVITMNMFEEALQDDMRRKSYYKNAIKNSCQHFNQQVC